MAETKNEQQPHSFKRKLGNTTYTVKVHFSKDIAKIQTHQETAALISQKPPCMNRRVKIPLLYDGFFSFAVVRQITLSFSFL